MKRTSGLTWIASVAVAGLGLVANTQAAPVRHDNLPGPGHYEWGTTVEGPNWYLDITLAASSQDGSAATLSAFYHTVFHDPGTGSEVGDVGGAQIGAHVHVGGDFDVFLLGFDAGELIPAAHLWDAVGYVGYEGFGSALPEGVETYLGVRFDPGDGFHHGWIGVVRTGYQLDAFAWGHETEPGVPIAAGVPEPGTLALLALGAAGLASRRRRQHA